MEVIDNFGADALRLFLMNSQVVRAEDLRYSDEGVKEVLKSIIIPLWNSYSFYVTYANIDGVQVSEAPKDPDNPLDRWILSEGERLVQEVGTQLDKYDLQKAIVPMVEFIDALNNWYIRRSRRRFWRSENDQDKLQAYQTLYSVLMKLITVACPVIPFVTEEIYQNLKQEGMAESIHLQDFPNADNTRRDAELEKKMEVTRRAVSMGRALRSIHSLKTRQPLKMIQLVTKDREEKRILREMEEIIREELNVKEVVFRENEEDLVEYRAKANFKILGKELGKDMKEAAGKIEKLKMREIQSLLEGSTLSLDLSARSVDLTSESIIVQRLEKEHLKVLNEGSLTVGLDSEITEELRQEGAVRDLVRSIQNLRKEEGFEVTDRIALYLYGDEEVERAVTAYQEYLKSETLSRDLSWEEREGAVAVPCGEKSCYVVLEKA
jgi:isoleucyl-tRNA synthetase